MNQFTHAFQFKTDRNSFYIGITTNADGNGTNTICVEQGFGQAPTVWEVSWALGEIHNRGIDVYSIVLRETHAWFPSIGWIQKNLVAYQDIPKWRIIEREGMSGCKDYTITILTSSLFGREKCVDSVHVSMHGKFNMTVQCSMPMMEHVIGNTVPLPADGDFEEWRRTTTIRELPKEDTREWKTTPFIE